MSVTVESTFGGYAVKPQGFGKFYAKNLSEVAIAIAHYFGSDHNTQKCILCQARDKEQRQRTGEETMTGIIQPEYPCTDCSNARRSGQPKQPWLCENCVRWSRYQRERMQVQKL